MRYLFYCVLGAGGAVIVWLFAARPVSIALDRLHTVLVEAPALDRFRYDNSVLELGDRTLYTLTSHFGRAAEVAIGAGGRAILTSGGRSFAFGPARALPSPSGFGIVDFAPDAGDAVRLTVERSLLNWPIPFEMNFMTGRSPSWRRHVYCRLRWTKRSGARLQMLWRDEQNYYAETGWVPTRITVITSGLLRVDIAETADLERAAVEYLRRTKNWDRAAYRLEDRGPASDASEEIVLAVHRDDEQPAHPGGGRSVELRLGYQSRRVTREIAGQ